MYEVKLKKFQGPLDLLLQLTEEKKMDISEISLAKITNQYLVYLKKIENIPLEDLANFLVVASRLILIKSKIILPKLELSEEEQEDIETLRMQLEEYKKFKNLAKKIEEIALAKNIAYDREKYQGLKPVFYPPKNFKLEELKIAFKKILEEISFLEKKLPQESLKLRISINEKIEELQKRLSDKVQITFQDIVKKTGSKIDIILNFLALL